MAAHFLYQMKGLAGRKNNGAGEKGAAAQMFSHIILSETNKNATKIPQKFAKEKIKKDHTPLKSAKKFDKINHSEEEKYASRSAAAEFFRRFYEIGRCMQCRKQKK